MRQNARLAARAGVSAPALAPLDPDAARQLRAALTEEYAQTIAECAAAFRAALEAATMQAGGEGRAQVERMFELPLLDEMRPVAELLEGVIGPALD